MLDGQTLLITGASRGIGAAAARVALTQGANVVAHYNSAANQAEALFQDFGAERVKPLQADLSDKSQVKRLWEDAVAWRNGLDGLVNNAAVMPYSAPQDEGWDADWADCLAVNVQAVADLCRYAILDWAGRIEPGRIVTVSSRAAFRGDMADAMHYAASKGATVALMRSIAKSYAKQGIYGFTVAPGWVKTERVIPRLEAKPEAIAETPMGDAAPPEQVGNLICFLLSGAVDHATGGTFDINGASYFH